MRGVRSIFVFRHRSGRVLRTLSAVLGLAVTVQVGLAQPAGVDSLALEWVRYVLPNGLQVLLQPDPTQSEVAVEFWVHVGTRHEAAGRYGLAHFFEHATPYGFRDDSVRGQVFRDALTGSNARTRPDFTRYYLKTTPENIELFLRYAAERLSADATDITPGWLEYHRGNVLEEITERANTLWAPTVKMAEAAGVFGAAHPYGHGSYGTVAENRAVSVDDLRRWLRANLRPEYTTLFVVGRFDPLEVGEVIEREFGPIPGGERVSREPVWPARPEGGMARVVARARQPTLAVSWPVAAWGSEDDPALRLIARVLDERLAEAPDAPASVLAASAMERFELHELAGLFSLSASHDGTSDGDEVADWLRSIVRELLVGGPTLEELVRAREAERASVRESLSELGWMGSRIDLLGRGLLFTGDPDAYLRRLERQATLSTNAVRETAVRWLARSEFAIHVIPTISADQ